MRLEFTNLDSPAAMKRLWILFLALSITAYVLLAASNAEAARIKDITNIQGVRSNQLIGYGLVVGLHKTGDDQKAIFTIQSLTSMLSRMGVRVNPAEIRAKNIAAVMITTDLPPFSTVGSRIDIQVSSIGNAKSLQGGTLLMTPLRGIDGKTYAIAQGPVLVGGYSFSADSGSSVTKNHPTVGRIPGGAIIEREVPYDINGKQEIVLSLLQQDFTTSSRLSEVINGYLGGNYAVARNAGSVVVEVPGTFQNRVVEMISQIETLQVQTDRRAKVILNERSGTVVMGNEVRISTIAISHGSLKIHIGNKLNVSQPNALAQGKTVVTPESTIKAEEEESRLAVVPKGVTIGQVVMALNAIGVSSRDLIDILQAIKAAGALEAEIDII